MPPNHAEHDHAKHAAAEHDHAEHPAAEHDCDGHQRDHDAHGHDHDEHGHGPHTHDFRAASRKALTTAGLLLAGIFVAELVGGLLTDSLALLADAGHLLTDVAAVGLALLAQRFARRAPCARQSYGFQRLEILAALVNGVTLWVIAVIIVWEAVGRLAHPEPVASTTMVAIAAVGLVVQSLAAIVLARASGESLNARGAYLHAATDAVQSAGVVATGLVLMATGWWLLDPLVSIAIAVLIAWSGGRVVWEATHVLMEGTPSDLDLEAVAESLLAQDGVERVSDLHAWSITTGFNALSAHLVTGPGLDAEARESLRDALAEGLRTRFPLHHLTLQVERECSLGKEQGCSEWIPTSANPAGGDA